MSENSASTSEVPVIDPTQWVITGIFVHDGITYGCGEPVPTMLVEVADALAARGLLARPDADGHITIVVPAAGVPTSAIEFLNGTDVIVLRKIRRFQPDKRLLRKIEREATRYGRSFVLIEALRVALGDPLEEPGA